VWLIRDGEIAARAEVLAGVRDTARTGSTATLQAGIVTAIQQAASQAGEDVPAFALAAGMLTSNLGLVELPHLSAPAGRAELSEAVERVEFSDPGKLAIYFVRGVRTGQVRCGLGEAPQTDIIRGEETEIVGALKTLSLDPPLLYFHLGSHSKVVRIDHHGRIVGGVTTLSGEIDHVVRTHTILSGALPPERMERADEALTDQGAQWAVTYGLSRTFFLIRILEQSGDYGPQQLGSVFAGAVASEDIHAMRGHGLLERGAKVVLSGRPRFQSVWKRLLEREGLAVTVLSAEDAERAFLAGLREIVFNSPVFREGD
jgi:2-dehydro-3-deoxygalactonokinase